MHIAALCHTAVSLYLCFSISVLHVHQPEQVEVAAEDARRKHLSELASLSLSLSLILYR